MKQVNSDYQAGSQIVVFDHVVATYIGGVHVDKTQAAARFTDGVIPAGTLLIPHTNGTFKPVNAAFTAENIAGAIGLTHFDVVIDDMPLVAVVTDGTARIDALPDKEKTGVAFVKAVLPKISLY